MTGTRRPTLKAQFDLACEVAANRCSLSMHRGDGPHRAIRITGCWKDEGAALAVEIRDALRRAGNPDAAATIDAGFVAVWVR